MNQVTAGFLKKILELRRIIVRKKATQSITRPAEYLQRKFKAQQYKLKVQKQLDIERDLKQIRVQNIKENKIPEQNCTVKRGVKLEIGLNQCTSDENTLQEEEAVGVQNETLTFENGMKLKEYKCVKEYEDYTDKAFEELCCPETGGPGIMTEGVPENRRRWRQEAPGTLMSTLAAAHLTSSSFSASEGELVGTLKQWLPKEDEGNVEMAFGIEVDKEQPRYDDDDTNFEESEGELRNEVVECLEKPATPKEEEKRRLASLRLQRS